jgi:Lrp/AsnC family leucine-responsive transcriptional regulator
MVHSVPLTAPFRQIKYKAKTTRILEKEVQLEQNPHFRSLDAIDRSILRALQKNARESFAEIGKTVGLSATTVAERIRRLESEGVIEAYQVKLSAAKLGYPVTAFILARPNGPDERFIQVAKAHSQVLACYRVTGDFSFIAHAIVPDVMHLEELLNQLEPAAVHIVTLVVLSTSFDSVPINVG